MIRLSKSRDTVAVVADQIGEPTPAGAIAEACLVIANALVSSLEKVRNLPSFWRASDDLGMFRARNIRTCGKKDEVGHSLTSGPLW